MFGLIRKDLLLIKENLKAMLLIFAVYIMLAVQGVFDMTMLFPLIGIVLIVSTFSYDDFNNWHAYALTLPNGRKNVVRAKYLASIIFVLALVILAFGFEYGVNYVKGNVIDWETMISSLIGCLSTCVITISMLYPIIFKFGATNGRVILFVAIFSIFGLGTLIIENVDLTFLVSLMNQLYGNNLMFLLIPLLLMVMLDISYFISARIFQNKEY